MEQIGFFKGKHGNIEVNLTPEAADSLDDCWGAITIPFYKGKLLMTYHPIRDGWEFPGGSREAGETVVECAIREAYEETGAELVNMIPVGYYKVVLQTGHTAKTAIFTADVKVISSKPLWSETGEIKAFSSLPDNLSFDDGVYDFVLRYLKSKGHNKGEYIQ